MIYMGENMSSLPDSIRADAPTCRSEWTFVVPAGTTESASRMVNVA